MNRYQSLGIAMSAWRDVIALSVRPLIWIPFLLVAAVQVAFLLLLLGFHLPAVEPVGLPLVRLLAGEAATHYPLLYFALPAMFFRVNLVLTALVASLAGGAATILFAQAFHHSREKQAVSGTLRRAPQLIAVTIVLVVGLFGIVGLASLVPDQVTVRSFAARWGVRGAVMALFILTQSLLAYSTAWVVLMGRGIWPAIRDSVRVTLRTFLPTLIVVGVSSLLLFPFSYASGRVEVIVDKFRPELVASLIVAQVMVQILATFLVVGSVTRLFLWRVEAAR